MGADSRASFNLMKASLMSWVHIKILTLFRIEITTNAIFVQDGTKMRHSISPRSSCASRMFFKDGQLLTNPGWIGCNSISKNALFLFF